MPATPAGGFSLSVEAARWLVSDEGRGCLDRTVAAMDAGDDELSVAQRLRRSGTTADHARAVTDAAQTRIRARRDRDDSDALILTSTALEQASHPAAAAARARRYPDAAPVTDLCSGVGSDSLAIAAAGHPVTAVDLDEARLILLAHNAAVRGYTVETVVADALARPVAAGTLVHADPSRRRDGRRLRRLGDYVPPVPDLVRRVRPAAGAGIVISPAVDLGDPGLPSDGELEFVQQGRQLLEASIWIGDLRQGQARARATLLDVGVSVVRTGPPVDLPVVEVGPVLLEPAPAAVRARVHGALGEEVGARRLARRRALLTADTVPDSPWFEAWAVETVLPLRPKAIRRFLQQADDAPVEIALHGVDADPEDWWRRLGRPPRGPQGRRLQLVRTDDRAVCLICRRP